MDIGLVCLTTGSEPTIPPTHRECLAVVWVVYLLRHYLERCQFTVRTDYDAFKWILNVIDATDKLARWPLRLYQLELDVA